MAPILDAAVWTKVEAILSQPETIATEVSRLRENDPTTADLSSIARRIAELKRQRTNLTKRLALFDDDDAAAPLVVEIEALAKQERQLAQDQPEVESMRVGWEAAQTRLKDLEYWCRVQSTNLATMTYEQKRLALRALNANVQVWAAIHTPRYAVKIQVDGMVPSQVSAPRSGADAVPVAAHADDYSRRGCASKGGRRGDRL